jgi:hypothetical protein
MAVDVKDGPALAAFLQQDIARWAEVIRIAKLKLD